MSCTLDEKDIQKTIAFHGHSCPGIVIGIRAAELALKRFGTQKMDLICVTETDMCGVDAIQVLTDCTYGKGNLIHKDFGKMAFSFQERSTGRGFRTVLKPGAGGSEAEELGRLMRKGEVDPTSEGDKEQIQTLRQNIETRYFQMDLKDMFAVSPIATEPPRAPHVLESLICEDCGELTMESKTRRLHGKTLCRPCFERVDQKS